MISTIESPFTEQTGVDRANAPFPELSQQLEKDLVQVFKLLADETRLKILMGLLREGEMHVSAMCDMLNQSQPAVSHHLALLRVAGIIEPRRDGKHNYYSVCQDRFHLLMGELFSTISDPQRDEFRFKSFVVTKGE
jgi:ArsR family transcriptional regulator, arsenate/arsenite/antimonite-responsive transcriptional repressor